MRILLLGKGNVPARYSLVSVNCENWVSRNFGGHEIITFGYNDGVDIQIQVDEDFKKVIEKLPNGWKPDICLLWEIDWNLLPQGIEHAPFPTIAIAWDWDYDILFAKGIFELTDFTVALGDFEKEAIHAIGAENVEVFYFIGVMKEYFASSPKKMKDRKYDILYTTWIDDVVLSDRSEWILKLCSLSDKFNICVDNPRLSYTDYNALLSDSKLVLSHHRYGSMSGRIIEAGAQGAVVLETGDEVKKHFVPDEEYIPVTKENFASQVDKYLKNENLLQEISNKTHAKATEEFEAGKRFLDLLEFIDKQLKDKNLIRKFKALTEYEKHIRRGEIFYFAYFRTPTYILNCRSKMLEQSIEEFKNAVEIDATPRAMTNLSLAMASYDFKYRKNKIMDEKGKEVISILNNVISDYPSYVIAYFHLGIIHLRIRNFEDALDMFNRALKLFKDANNVIDPWCLYINDFERFPLRKAINKNLLSLCKGEDTAIEHIKDLYQAATEYYISLAEEEIGYIYKTLDVLLKSHKSHPDSGLVAKKAAYLLSVTGFKEDSIAMYKKAIKLLPFNIDLRVDYIKLLYLYQMDKEAIDEINNTLDIMRTVHSLNGKHALLQDTLESFGRVKLNSRFSHDSCKERILNEWAENLFICLSKDPKNINLISRIIDLWRELGRVDKAFEIVEGYIKKHLDRKHADERIFSYLQDVLDNLQKQCESRYTTLNERLHRLKKVVGGIRVMEGVKAN